MGGRSIKVGELEHVHNLWLDVAYDAGVLPLFLLIIFHTFHLDDFIKILRSKLPVAVKIGICCLIISFFFSFMKQPTLQGARLYFIGSCLFLGMLHRLVCDTRRTGLLV
jgi:hypothetical protein